jgi:hypothetical protein
MKIEKRVKFKYTMDVSLEFPNGMPEEMQREFYNDFIWFADCCKIEESLKTFQDEGIFISTSQLEEADQLYLYEKLGKQVKVAHVEHIDFDLDEEEVNEWD